MSSNITDELNIKKSVSHSVMQIKRELNKLNRRKLKHLLSFIKLCATTYTLQTEKLAIFFGMAMVKNSKQSIYFIAQQLGKGKKIDNRSSTAF